MYSNKELIEKYPFLKVKDTYTAGTWTNCWLDDLEPGWRAAFGEDLAKELDKAIKEDGCEDTFEFVQIKEKYASLRLYADGYGDKTKEVLAKYEELSKYICGHCGQVATRITRGWVYPFCDKCARKIGQPTVPIEEFYETTYEDILDEIDHIKINYRYDDYWKPIK